MKNRYTLDGDTAIIYVDRRDGTTVEVYIDAEDVPRLKGKRVGVQGTKRKGWYARFTDHEGDHRLHRFLMGAPDDRLIDHIDLNKLNNRKINLRIVTESENSQNQMGRGPHRGVRWNTRDACYQVAFKYKGQRIFGGYFQVLEEAVVRANQLYCLFMPLSPQAKAYQGPPLDPADVFTFTRASNTSGAKGVQRIKNSSKWRVFIRHRLAYYTGSFDTYEQAVEKAREVYRDISVKLVYHLLAMPA